MKILHTADLHLCSPLTSRLCGSKSIARRRELRETFIRMTEYARENGIGAFIIAGDLFDEEEVSSSELDSFLNSVRRAEGIEFYYLAGNHEGKAIESRSDNIPTNLHIFGEEWTGFDIEGVRIVGRSKTAPDMFFDLALDPSKINIAVLHGEIRDKSDERGGIGLSEAADKPLDYIALGHYHSYRSEKISKRAYAVYSGTPEGRGFDEIGEKGFVVIDTDGGVSHSFVPFAKRQVMQIDIDISDALSSHDIERMIEDNLKNASKNNLIRIRLTGYRFPETRYDISYLADIFKSGYYYLEVKDSSRIKINPDDYKYDKSLKGEFIRLCLTELPDEEARSKAIECGLMALAGQGEEV